MSRLTASAMLVMVFGCSQPGHLRRDEQLVLFPTVGYRLDGSDDWVLPVRGWVFQDSWWVRNIGLVKSAIQVEHFIESPSQRETLRERVVPFLVSNQEGRRLRLELGDHSTRLSPALENGHIHDSMRLSAADLDQVGTSEGRCVQYHISTRDDRECVGTVHLLDREGLTIVSDIDDTIRITDVLNTKQMLKNTFVRPFRPVPGMAALYELWAQRYDARFVYLSASPAQLFNPMQDFLESSGFPAGAVCLRSVKWQGNMLQDLLELLDAPFEYKLAELVWLMQALPGREYVLVGDSAQEDPEVYAAIARAFPRQVQRILIRDVTCCEGRDAPRYRLAFHDLPDSLWVLFRDPATLIDEVTGPYQERTREVKPDQPPGPEVFIQKLAAYN